jgi:hypothetical protein
MSFDWKRFSNLDRAIVAGAGVAFVAAFLPWWGASVVLFSVSVDGWSAGFTAWAGTLLLTAAGVLVVLRRSGAKLSMGTMGPSVIVAGVAAVGLLLVIIRWLSLPRYRSVDVGARYGIYVALLAGVVEVAAAVAELRASREPSPLAQTPQGAEHTEPDSGAPAVPDE